MKYRNTLIALFAVLILGHAGTASAATEDETPSKAEQAKLQAQLEAENAEQAKLQAQLEAKNAEQAKLKAQLEAEYEKAITLAEQERLAAKVSMGKAREQLQLASEQSREVSAESSRERAAQEAEMEKMHQELNTARRQLQETSREIARVNREVSRARSARHATGFAYRTFERPVIGVILGESTDVGVRVIGVSPDGPAEQAGVKQDDVIVAVSGRVLVAVEESGDAKDGLHAAMHDIKVDEPLIISVERGDKTLDLTIVPEIREPLTWQTVTRFPTAPAVPGIVVAPGKVVTIERIVVPEINTEELGQQIEQMRAEIDERRALMEVRKLESIDSEVEFEFHEMSELGNFALQDANVWFGLPMTQGLRLAEIDAGLGQYFKTDRGVLVLKARADNDLQLESGDVVLQVGDTEVNSPAEFMRALRGFESGDELEIDIKRNRRDRTLKTVMPENRTSFFAPSHGEQHTIKITTQSD